MSEFTAIDLTGETIPEGICSECAQSGIQHGPSQMLIVHCRHNLRGAYRVLDRPWKIIAGIEAGIFGDAVIRGLTHGELRADIDAGVAKILEQQAAGATKH